MTDGCDQRTKLSVLDCTVELENTKQPRTSRPVGLQRARIAGGQGYRVPGPAAIQYGRKIRRTDLEDWLTSPSVSFS